VPESRPLSPGRVWYNAAEREGMKNSARDRFMDDRHRISDFADGSLVVCPQCGKCAQVTRLPGQRVRLLCASCALAKDKTIQSHGIVPGKDWYFHLPLWLTVPYGGGLVWAFNWHHLAWLEGYVRAALREKRPSPAWGWSNQSAAGRLPRHIKSAKNRRDILHGIEKLKGSMRKG